jgi:hypothetical protein
MTAEEQIRLTIASYVQAYHTYVVDDFVRLFTDDGAFITRTPNDVYRGKAALERFAINRQDRSVAMPSRRVKLICGASLIKVHGETAEALTDFIVFYLNGESPWYVKMGDPSALLVGQWYINIVGLYADKLVHIGDEWLFAERRIIAAES